MKSEDKRDRFDERDGELTERERARLAALKEVAKLTADEDKTLAAYKADIVKLLT